MQPYDVLIVGSGAAGISAAVHARKTNPSLSVAIVCKTMPTRTATCMAEGGCNAVMPTYGTGDSFESHLFDTVFGADYLCDQDIVEIYVHKIVDLVYQTDKWGLPYNRRDDRTWDCRWAGGAAFARTVYAADKTGHMLQHACFEQALAMGIPFIMDTQALSLAVHDGEIQGLVVRDLRTGEVRGLPAKTVILAAGGYGRISWHRVSSLFGATGDGVAMAMDAGLPFKDPEMIQFHPSGVAHGGVLITEVARGIGGYLLNRDGERFMHKYAPKKMELGPRDIVARGIEREIREGRGFGEGMHAHVHLSLTHLDPDMVRKNLPQVIHTARTFEDVDLVTQPLPIRPTVHYCMGGVDIADCTMQTAIRGLFCAGENACASIHGANRLGGNALGDALVTGAIAGEGAAAMARQRGSVCGETLETSRRADRERLREIVDRPLRDDTLFAVRDEMGAVMWHHLGLFRDKTLLEDGRKALADLRVRYAELGIGNASPVYNTVLTQYLELGNLLLCTAAAFEGALWREESRGAHTREDFPERDDERFLKHTLVYGMGGDLRLDTSPVRMTRFTPQPRTY